jgi:hypothetical protein
MTDFESTSRPAIPAELMRQVLVEAGHRCAIPTCRQTEIDVHHITPWETCRKHEFENLIALCPNCHRRVHKNEIDRKSLKEYKRKLSLRVDHGVFAGGDIELDRSQGELHSITIAGTSTISTSGWKTGLEKIVLKISNAGKHAITFPTKLPTGFRLTENGYDLIEFTHIDGDIHITHVLAAPTVIPNAPAPALSIIDSFPILGQAITVTEIKDIFIKFNNPIDRNTVCYIVNYQFRQNSICQWDTCGWIQFAEGDTKLMWHIHDHVLSNEKSYSKEDDSYHRFEIHVSRPPEVFHVKDIYGNSLPHTIIPVHIKA